MKINWMRLAIFFVHKVIYANGIRQITWKENTSQRNNIYHDAVLFTGQLSSTVRCAYACLVSTAVCTGFSFTSTSSTCRGYSNTALTNQSFLQHTKTWKKACQLEALGYTYDSVFDTCLKFYQMERIKDEAANACASDGAYLLIPDTVQKLNALKARYSDDLLASDWWWVGGYDYGDGEGFDFRWEDLDGRPIDNSVWYPGEPNVLFEKCVTYYLNSERLFNMDCNYEAFYACQETV